MTDDERFDDALRVLHEARGYILGAAERGDTVGLDDEAGRMAEALAVLRDLHPWKLRMRGGAIVSGCIVRDAAVKA